MLFFNVAFLIIYKNTEIIDFREIETIISGYYIYGFLQNIPICGNYNNQINENLDKHNFNNLELACYYCLIKLDEKNYIMITTSFIYFLMW